MLTMNSKIREQCLKAYNQGYRTITHWNDGGFFAHISIDYLINNKKDGETIFTEHSLWGTWSSYLLSPIIFQKMMSL